MDGYIKILLPSKLWTQRPPWNDASYACRSRAKSSPRNSAHVVLSAPVPRPEMKRFFLGSVFLEPSTTRRLVIQVTDIDMVYMQMYIYIIKYIFIYVIWCILKSTNSMAYRRNIDIVMYEWNFFFCVYANFIWHLGKYRGTYITK